MKRIIIRQEFDIHEQKPGVSFRTKNWMWQMNVLTRTLTSSVKLSKLLTNWLKMDSTQKEQSTSFRHTPDSVKIVTYLIVRKCCRGCRILNHFSLMFRCWRQWIIKVIAQNTSNSTEFSHLLRKIALTCRTGVRFLWNRQLYSWCGNGLTAWPLLTNNDKIKN